jgi:hypothetical protein
LLIALSAAFAHPLAQAPARKAMTVDDYTKWRSISSQEISGDGKWVVYVLQLTNVAPTDTKPVLHLRNLQTNDEITVADATGPAFSTDSKWLGRAERHATAVGRAGRAAGTHRQSAAATAAARRAAESRDRRRAVMAGHSVVRVLPRRDPPRPEAAARERARHRRRTRS